MQRISVCAGAAAAAFVSAGVQGQIVVGLGEGGPPVVRVYDPFNPDPPLALVYPAAPNFTGGIRVAVGDVNGDGLQDTVTGLGPGGPAEVRVYSGLAHVGPGTLLLTNSNTYGPSYTGGVHVAAGDVNNDGRAEVITGTATGSTHVKVFSGATGTELQSFFAFPGFTGGVFVGSGDVNGDGFDDIIVGADANGHVKVFSGSTGAEIRSFFAFAGFIGGTSVAGARSSSGGFDDIIVGAGAGAPGGHVKVFDGQTGAMLASFSAFGPSFIGGVRVASADVDGDGIPEIIAGTGPGGPPQVRVFSRSGAFITSFVAGDPGFTGGVFVAGADSGCYPDCTGDGALSVADFGCFQTKFVGGSPYADCNGDGVQTVADFGCFQTKFVQGCP